MSLISFIPDWILFFIIGIVLIWIYSYLPEEVKGTVKGILIKYGVLIALLIILIYWHGKTGPIYASPDKWPADVNRATFFCGLGALIYVSFLYFWYQQRYHTTFFICDNIKGSCARWLEIGNVAGESNDPWVVLFLGTAGRSDDHVVLPWPFPKQIVVVPRSTIQFLGNQIVSYSKVERCDVDTWSELDEDVHNFLKHDPMAKWVGDQVYYGYAPIDVLSKSPKYRDLLLELEKKNSRINELKEMLRGKLTTTKGFISDTVGMTDKVRGKTPWNQGQPPPQNPNE